MLVCLQIFTVYFTKNKFKELSRAALRLAALYAAFEVAVFTINPICEVALGYVRGAGSADRENVQGPPGIQGTVPVCDYRNIKATPLRWELRASTDLLPQSCSMKNGKYIQYSHADVRVAQLLLGKVIMGLQATGVSTGISTGGIIAEPDANLNQQYERADKALYEAKRQGRGRLVIS